MGKEFDIGTKAIKLMEYTMTITSNRKRYPAKHLMLINRIQNCCMDIYENAIKANRTDLNTLKIKRQEFQTNIITYCDMLSCYAELSMNLNLIGSDTVSFWQKQIGDVKYMTLAWRTKEK